MSRWHKWQSYCAFGGTGSNLGPPTGLPESWTDASVIFSFTSWPLSCTSITNLLFTNRPISRCYVVGDVDSVVAETINKVDRIISNSSSDATSKHMRRRIWAPSFAFTSRVDLKNAWKMWNLLGCCHDDMCSCLSACGIRTSLVTNSPYDRISQSMYRY
jgi:hypothetical protein